MSKEEKKPLSDEETSNNIHNINNEEPSDEAYEGESEKLNEDTKDEYESAESLKESFAELNDKHLRLYAEFENFKKVAARSRQELLKYSNEDLLRDLLTVIDHLELALQHSSGDEASESLSKGVEMTLKEMKGILDKYGLVRIDSIGKPFDPNVHHAMSQIETDEFDENTVVEELRKGFMFKDRVLRAALVGVSKRKSNENENTEIEEEE